MDFFLIPNNPENSVLVSANGVAHYQIRTAKLRGGVRVTHIQRPADSTEDSIVAEIEWKSWETPTIIRSPLLGGLGRCVGKPGVGVRARKFLYRRRKLSPSRYFVGNDGEEYQWMTSKNSGYVLLRSGTDEEVARHVNTINAEGLFAGERKSALRIQPCSLDIDLIVLSFVVMEKKRRERTGDGMEALPHDEDPQGEGCVAAVEA
ncbi:TonB box-containing protein [Laccaria bicolor S238N-H82]|uniref:TonB box-containing protein n=1 Tax=Laccaria bicolor (strain S238N-H82 / ATCC MYA-4686) TaxID=486041 RepID=B0D3A5_LACBS|nr:TonB box-containing protein [Laccaria bicolor S238N-H82]EDR11248.1 TonB box-containing protein [Laccaria bicolor S238N-H82]|eukprot:XP_001878549.1 TonB box-containing protein [Laccaria bicolor S238N-H82]